MIERTCNFCGEVFTVKFQSQEKRFCNSTCYGADVKTRPRKPIQHGTSAGKQAHYKRGEKPCEDCRQAARDAYRSRAHVYQENRRRARQEDPERFKAYAKDLYWRNPDQARQRRREYVARNRDAVNLKKRLDRLVNAERIDAGITRWREENPHMVKAKERRRRERQDSASESATRAFRRWTSAEDHLVLGWEGGDLELAFALGRRYHAVATRRNILRKRAARQSSQ